jgi:RNA polymerase sigma factor (TIGR02999 family)
MAKPSAIAPAPQVGADRPRTPPRALLEAHYDEFRRVAAGVLNGEAHKLQIQPTDLAHEAVIRLSGLDRMDIAGRTHFLSLSARVMRQILIDEVRRMRARKRQMPPVSTLLPPELGGSMPVDIEILDRVLTRLEAESPAHASLVERRFFVGLTLEEIAAVDGVSLATVKRQWRAARAWLMAEMGPT